MVYSNKSNDSAYTIRYSRSCIISAFVIPQIESREDLPESMTDKVLKWLTQAPQKM